MRIYRRPTASLIWIRWNVCATRGPDRAQAVSGHHFGCTLSFDDLHTDVILLRTGHSQEAQASPVEICETTSWLGRGATVTENRIA